MVLHTPLAFKMPVLRLGAASMPSVVIACTDPRRRPAANATHFIAMFQLTVCDEDLKKSGHDAHFKVTQKVG